MYLMMNYDNPCLYLLILSVLLAVVDVECRLFRLFFVFTWLLCELKLRVLF